MIGEESELLSSKPLGRDKIKGDQMVKMGSTGNDNPSPPSVEAHDAIDLINRQVQKANEYLQSWQLPKNEYSAWEAVTENYLVMIFGSSSPNVRKFMDIGKSGSFPMEASEGWWENHRIESITEQMRLLEGYIELLQTQLELSGTSSVEEVRPLYSNRIFLVHGHDESVLHQATRFLESLGLEVIILREQPNEGRTIIEKFIDYSDVAYAVVLLTPDDRGGIADSIFDDQLLRARQNVILELGFFIGKLGRHSVSALYIEDVEIPSDYSGVVYIPFDESGGWKLLLGRELKAAGFEIDMNKVT